VYLPFDQVTYRPADEMTFALRTSGDHLRSVSAVRKIARQADPRVPVKDFRTQAAQIDQTMNREIIFARLCTAFAAVAAHCLRWLVRDDGLRSSAPHFRDRDSGGAWAQHGDVIWIVLRQVFVRTAAGLAIGVPVALSASKLVESFLFLRSNRMTPPRRSWR